MLNKIRVDIFDLVKDSLCDLFENKQNQNILKANTKTYFSLSVLQMIFDQLSVFYINIHKSLIKISQKEKNCRKNLDNQFFFLYTIRVILAMWPSGQSDRFIPDRSVVRFHPSPPRRGTTYCQFASANIDLLVDHSFSLLRVLQHLQGTHYSTCGLLDT